MGPTQRGHLGLQLVLRGKTRHCVLCCETTLITAVPGCDLVPAEPTNPQLEPTFHTRTVETAGS